MADIKEVVSLTITRQTKAVSRAGFGVMAVVSPHVVFSERLRYYTEAADMLTDGFESTDPAYIAVNSALSQSPRPQRVAVGRRQVDQVGVSVDTVIDSTDYTVTINGTDFVYNSGVGATAASIATGLFTAINAGAEPVTATDDTDGTLTLDADVAGVVFTVAVDSNMSIEKPLTTADTVTNDLTAINNYVSDWYALVLTSHVAADVALAAAWVESAKKLYLTSSSDTNILDAGSTTDIGYTLNAAAYDRTGVLYSAVDTLYPEAAWFGRVLPANPGSINWAYKTLVGITYDGLTPTQSAAAFAKEVNTYEEMGSVNITRFGTVASGEYIDVIRGIDWFEARLQERIFSRYVNLDKIPYTDAGIAIHEGEVRAQIADGIGVGLFTNDPEPTVTVPVASAVSSADKIARELNGVEFVVYLAGAINKSSISGIVTI